MKALECSECEAMFIPSPGSPFQQHWPWFCSATCHLRAAKPVDAPSPGNLVDALQDRIHPASMRMLAAAPVAQGFPPGRGCMPCCEAGKDCLCFGQVQTTPRTLTVLASDLAAMERDNAHLRAQRDDLQRTNTRLVEERRAVDWTAQLQTMFSAFEQARPRQPAWPDEETIELRRSLFAEEARETLDAIIERDMVEVADGVIDTCVVGLGMLMAFGIDPRPIWAEVLRSNMAKVAGGITRNAAGKVQKPPGWTQPDVAGELQRQGYRVVRAAAYVGGGSVRPEGFSATISICGEPTFTGAMSYPAVVVEDVFSFPAAIDTWLANGDICAAGRKP